MGNGGVRPDRIPMRKALMGVLKFVDTHPGGTRRKAMFTYRYNFSAPELKRAPFRLSTINEACELGLLDCIGDLGGLGNQGSQEIKVSTAGRWWLADPVTCGSASDARCAHNNRARSCRGNR